MKSFKFKQFEIQQSKNVFRVGTDGVLLGSLANVDNVSKVLEVGTGTGLISLMLAQRNSQADFLGIDINEELAKKFPFRERVWGGAWDTVRRADGGVVKP